MDHRTADALGLLIEELEAVVAAQGRLRAELAQLQARRRRLVAMIELALPDLPKTQRDWQRIRLKRILNEGFLEQSGPARDRFSAVLDFLATTRDFPVSALTTHLRAKGLDVNPGYASDTLKRFERQGLVTKLRHGRYRVNEGHVEALVRL